MNDVYIEKMTEKIKSHIKDGKFPIAGDYLMDLCHYGIEIENEILVFLASELSDIYRNSIARAKEYGDNSDIKFIDEIKLNTFLLLDFMLDLPVQLESEKIDEIFKLLVFIVYHGERIQYNVRKNQNALYLQKRRLGDLG